MKSFIASAAVLLIIVLTVSNCLPEYSPIAPACTTVFPQNRIDGLNQTLLKKDKDTIDAYLKKNSIVALKDSSGLRYKITQVGDGSKTPCLESNVTVKYKGTVYKGTTPFDEQTTNAVTFNLSQLIYGWQIAFLKFSPGTKATLYIPSGLGYGTRVLEKIPANSILVFDVELVGF